jgi:hypothetical protein
MGCIVYNGSDARKGDLWQQVLLMIMTVIHSAISRRAGGHSHELSFDEAFASAVAQVPALEPVHPDTLKRCAR